MSAIELKRVPGIEDIVTDLLSIIRAHTKSVGEGWSAATTIEETGVDSFDFVELIFDIEDKYGVNIDLNANTSAADITTVADVASLVQAAIKGERQTS